MLTRKAQAVLVCTLVFAVFYVSIFAELCVVDDTSNLLDIANWQGISLKAIFLPGCAEGGYYRPLIGLSYLLNLRLWDLDVKTLHLENVLLHTAAALMVYLLARAVLERQGRERTMAPAVAGLLFGLHPIVTESVDWISGRTDLIAGFFVYLAALFLVRYSRSRSRYLLVAAACSVFVGLLGKETALGFIPGAIFLLTVRPEQEELAGHDRHRLSPYQEGLLLLIFGGGTAAIQVVLYNFWTIFATAPLYLVARYFLMHGGLPERKVVILAAKRVAWCAVALLIAGAIFYGIRKVVFTSDLPRIPRTLKLFQQDTNYALEMFLGGSGFYIKKFFFPFPLNFAIREIDPFYPLVGTILFFVGLFFATRRSMATSLALAGVFMFAPALPLVLGTVAWTAYAERYVYISAGFWSIALVYWLAPRLERHGRAGAFAVALLLLLMAAATLERNLVWQKNLTLVRDTAQKSPLFRDIRVAYMGELLKVGDLAGARNEYYVASSLPCIGYNERLDSYRAQLYLMEKNPDQAIATYRKILVKTRGGSVNARRQIEELLKNKAAESKEPEVRRAALQELESLRGSSPKKGKL